MADFYRPPDRRRGVGYPRIKQQGHMTTEQIAAELRREFEAAMDRIEEVAKLLDADAEEMEREATLLAASTTMDRATALHHVANERLSAALKEGGALHG